ncbi:MAG: hypothetical protein ACMUEM_04245 [Flavobacteriales bacterium AspAUS03]
MGPSKIETHYLTWIDAKIQRIKKKVLLPGLKKSNILRLALNLTKDTLYYLVNKASVWKTITTKEQPPQAHIAFRYNYKSLFGIGVDHGNGYIYTLKMN